MAYMIDARVLSYRGKVRENNEDSYYFDGVCSEIGQPRDQEISGKRCSTRNYHCFGVFDGMGGCMHGEQASFLAARSVYYTWRIYEKVEAIEPETLLAEAYERMNRAVLRRLEQIKCGQMGSTAALLLFHRDFVVVSNVGDSRIFRFRNGDGSMLSQDHTDWKILEMMKLQNEKPQLTQYIGMNEEGMVVEPFVKRFGDYYLICSDGLTDLVSLDQMKQVFAEKGSLEEKMKQLYDLSWEAGATDNTTMILCRIRKRWEK